MRTRHVLAGVRGGRWVPLYDPVRDPIHGLAERYDREYGAVEAVTWIVAVLLDAVDFATTLAGVDHPRLIEGVPLSRWMLVRFGWPGLLAEHLGALALLALLWLSLPRPYRLVVPGMAAWTGFAISRGNVLRLVRYGVIDVPW